MSATVPVDLARKRRSDARRRRLMVSGGRLVLGVVIVAGWEFGARAGVIDKFFWSQPSDIGATLWRGSIVMTTSLYFAVGFIAIFIVGGITGIFLAVFPIDWQLTDTYFVVAHFHYVLMGGAVFSIFAGIYYWFPKMSGRLLNERLGKVSFWLMFVGFNVAFFVQHALGLDGMPRRIYTYGPDTGWGTYNMISTGHEQKASRVVQRQPLQLVTAHAPLSDHFVGPRIDGHRVSGLFDVCVESPLLIVDGVPFGRSVQRDFRFQFQMARVGSVEHLNGLIR